MPRPQSSTSVGASGSQASSAPSTSSGALKQRRAAGNTTVATKATRPAGESWKYYHEDAPGIKVQPVPVLVFSLGFIVVVFLLHIWGKLTR